jgi:hypothetical protein
MHFQRETNRHGIYNGVNLAGINVAALYLELQANPSLTIDEFLAKQDVFYRVVVPASGLLDIQQRYPWLTRNGYVPGAQAAEISFTQSGLPVRVEWVRRDASEPYVSFVTAFNFDYGQITNRVLTGSRFDYTLSESGRRYLHLLTLDPHPVVRTERAPERTTVRPVELPDVAPPRPPAARSSGEPRGW